MNRLDEVLEGVPDQHYADTPVKWDTIYIFIYINRYLGRQPSKQYVYNYHADITSHRH